MVLEKSVRLQSRVLSILKSIFTGRKNSLAQECMLFSSLWIWEWEKSVKILWFMWLFVSESGWVCNSVVGCSPQIPEALGSIPNITKEGKNTLKAIKHSTSVIAPLKCVLSDRLDSTGTERKDFDGGVQDGSVSANQASEVSICSELFCLIKCSSCHPKLATMPGSRLSVN